MNLNAQRSCAIAEKHADATEKLVDKIERLKKRQGVMKRANHLIRKADREGLADLGFSEEAITKLFSQDYDGRVGFPNYALTNNSANIRRLEKRLAAIQNAQHDETTEEQFPGGGRLVDNVEVNRLQIFFPEIPQITNRQTLRRILRYWQTCSLPGHPVYLLGMLHDHRARKRCFWHALTELRRLKLISEGRLPNPWKRS